MKKEREKGGGLGKRFCLKLKSSSTAGRNEIPQTNSLRENKNGEYNVLNVPCGRVNILIKKLQRNNLVPLSSTLLIMLPLA